VRLVLLTARGWDTLRYQLLGGFTQTQKEEKELSASFCRRTKLFLGHCLSDYDF
jgi:hypothetical protein